MKTLARHSVMTCKSYELKVDKSHLSDETLRVLRRLFLEAKWFYNDMLARSKQGEGGIWSADYKRTEVLVKNNDGQFESRALTWLSAQMRQGVIKRAKDSVRGLSALKKHGRKVGALKFKSRMKSIPLNQYGKTHRIKGKRVFVQNVKQPLKVMGLVQIPAGAELANATLELRSGDFYLHIVTYQTRSEKQFPLKVLGIDFGIDRQLTLSNGLDIEEAVAPTKKLRRIHRELSRRKLHGRNRLKTNLRLNREYSRITNKRRDIMNKLVSQLVSRYETIKVQDDNIKGWQKMWGRRIQASAIGGLMSALKEGAHTSAVVPRYFPTTQQCSLCGNIQHVDLKQRIYHCGKCRLMIDRNYNSSVNILNYGVPVECRELTPVDTKTATEMMECLNSVPGISASLVIETGSPRLQAVR